MIDGADNNEVRSHCHHAAAARSARRFKLQTNTFSADSAAPAAQ